jgi:hypothetical protein
MSTPRSLIRHPSALTITLTTLAATDLAYRLLLREPLRRALGMGQVARPSESVRRAGPG